MSPLSRRTRALPSLLSALLLGFLTSSCAGGPSPGGGSDTWEALTQPRPAPLEGAARVTVSEFLVVKAGNWGLDPGTVGPGVALAELVAADLLRRRDVHFVERRRFSEAAERARRGQPRPIGAPRVGQSPGAELILVGSWVPVDSQTAALDLRLTEAQTGDVVQTWRVVTPASADPTSLARVAAGSFLQQLRTMGRRPTWRDPIESSGIVTAPSTYQDTGVPENAVVAFARGLAAEERYDWEAARRAYRAAQDAGGESFFEPQVALERVARLRAGGTLGAS